MKYLATYLEGAAKVQQTSEDRVAAFLLEAMCKRLQEPLTQTSPIDFRMSGQMASLFATGTDELDMLASCNQFFEATSAGIIAIAKPEDRKTALATLGQLVSDFCRAIAAISEEREQKVRLMALRARTASAKLREVLDDEQ